MEVTQRARVLKTQNAGLVVVIVLEIIAIVLISVLACFLRQVHVGIQGGPEK